MILTDSALWKYLSPNQRVLAGDGEFLVKDSIHHPDQEPTDYSYLVFPFAKMYEGFLKQLFLDAEYITQKEYFSNHFRIGKVLSPNLAGRLGIRSVYAQTEQQYGRDMADCLWKTWKEGRNLVFHYFPHNYRALSREHALILIDTIIKTMTDAVGTMKMVPNKSHKY